MRLFLFFLPFIFITFSLSAQVTLKTDRPQALYQTGETLGFVIQSGVSDSFHYTIRRDSRTNPLAAGVVWVIGGLDKSIFYTSTEPDMVVCSVQSSSGSASAGAAISPYDIVEKEPDPADFDDFWKGQISLLAQIPMDARIAQLFETSFSKTYSVNLATVAGRRVYGYISIPKGSGPFPAILTLPPYGALPGVTVPEADIAEIGGAISMSISIHNVSPDQTDPNAYLPDNFSVRDSGYYRLAVLAGERAIDYIFTRPEFDGVHLGLTGVSQGGGLSFLVGGVDPRVKMITSSDPALADPTGGYHGYAGGFPQYYNQVINSDPATIQKVVEATKYIDAVRGAKRFKGAALVCAGYIDDVCPPATTFELFNQLTGSKLMVHDLDLGHTHPDEYWNGRFDFWRRNFTAMKTPPKPYIQPNTGFFVNPGNDTTLPSGARSIILSGISDLNGVASSAYSVSWKKISGPGAVVFSSPNSYKTQATFDQTGDYTLSFSADDNSRVSASRRLTAAKMIKISIGGTTVGVMDTPPHNMGPVTIIKVFPNPTDNYITIQLQSDKAEIANFDFYNAFGVRIREERRELQPGDNTHYFDLSNFSQGSYLLKVDNDSILILKN